MDLTYNEKAVLEAIWRFGPVTRSEIAVRTGLTASAVTGLANKLSQKNLIETHVRHNGQRGQPLRPMNVHAHGAYSLGVSFTYKTLEAALINLAGNVEAKVEEHLNSSDLDAVLEATYNAVRKLVAVGPVSLSECVGLGVALPGDFLLDRRLIETYGRFPSFDGIDLCAAFGSVFPGTVYLENDGVSGAIGESIHGATQRVPTFAFIHIRHGIKAGFFVEGRPYRGAFGNAGMIGAMWPGGEGARPSGEDLISALESSGVTIEDYSDFGKLVPNKVMPLKDWCDRAAIQLSEGLRIMSRIFDPQAIVFGGNLSEEINQYLVSQVVLADDHELRLPLPSLLTSSLGAMAAVIGAASVPIFNTFFASAETERIGPNRFGRRVKPETARLSR